MAFLDSDDLWMPTKLEVQMGALRVSRVGTGATRRSITSIMPVSK